MWCLSLSFGIQFIIIIFSSYLDAGAEMEVNISHRSRQEILNTTNLADTNLFNNALNELMQLMKTVDYLASFL